MTISSLRSTSSNMPQDARHDRRRAIDLAIRFTLGLTFALSAGFYFQNALGEFHKLDPAHIDGKTLTFGLSILAIGLYTLMIACLYVLRLRPVSKFAGAWPCAAAILGGFLMSGLLLLRPRDDLPLSIQIAASVLVLVGNIFTVLVLLRLGRSFSILPEGRRLVTTGPYKIVRHPLYLAEAVATLGVLINFLSPWALILVAAQTALQLVRIRYEERVLRETFPEYAEYAKHTAQLIPGIY
jgi:protein-S-isoprenylcysteine O-methyltransferase Ste14